jgi:hypothetical protein
MLTSCQGLWQTERAVGSGSSLTPLFNTSLCSGEWQQGFKHEREREREREFVCDDCDYWGWPFHMSSSLSIQSQGLGSQDCRSWKASCHSTSLGQRGGGLGRLCWRYSISQTVFQHPLWADRHWFLHHRDTLRLWNSWDDILRETDS